MPVELRYVALKPLLIQEKDDNGDPLEDHNGNRVITHYQPGDVVPAHQWGSAANHMVEYRRIALLAVDTGAPAGGERAEAFLDTSALPLQDENAALHVTGEDGAFPIQQGAGWFTLSDGTRVRGKDAAFAAESELEA